MLVRPIIVLVALAHVIAYGASSRVRAVLPLGFVLAWGGVALALVAARLARARAAGRAYRQLEDYQAEHGLPLESYGWPTVPATLSTLRDAAVDAAGQPVAELELELAGHGGSAPERVVHRQRVPRAAAAQLAPGVALVVRRDASAPGRVVIDWDASFPGQMPRPPMGLA